MLAVLVAEVGAEGPVCGDDDRDLLACQRAARRRSAIATSGSGRGRPRCRRRSRCAPRPRPSLVEGLDPHPGRAEALDQRLAGSRRRSAPCSAGRWRGGRSGGRPRPSGPARRAPPARGRRRRRGPACSAYPFEHGALRLARVAGRRRAGPWRGCRAARPGRRTAARSAGRAGARRRGASIGSMSGTQPQVSPADGSSRSCGTNRSRPQSSALASSSSSRSTGRAGALELGSRLRRCRRRRPTSSSPSCADAR